jgi:hypothetical protein
MNRVSPIAITMAGAVALLSLTAAQRPSLFIQTSPGLWEVGGVPGAKLPLRQCLADVSMLARFEHRNLNCTQNVITQSASAAVIDYSCGGAGFGHSEVALITPRSLRIGTQGISNRLPFNYTLQARRIGDCPAANAALRH